MLLYYLILDVPVNASDDVIREKYLELVKKFTPEKNPEQFKKISEAYNALKDKQTRVHKQIFGYSEIKNEQGLYDLAEALRPARRRATLKELIHEAT